MGKPTHLALHPFNRVPVLRHDDFTVYETSAIVPTSTRCSTTPRCRRKTPRPRAHAPVDQRGQFLLLPLHDLPRDARAPGVSTSSASPPTRRSWRTRFRKSRRACRSLERQLAHGKDYLFGADLTLADFYLLPCTFAFSLTDEGKAMYPKYPAFCRWRETMEALPTVQRFRASLAAARPIEHARQWAVSHRPKY